MTVQDRSFVNFCVETRFCGMKNIFHKVLKEIILIFPISSGGYKSVTVVATILFLGQGENMFRESYDL